ncbi:hypothetical protein SADUNF_Sadunf03G0065300 [Salix dunnii]|uniref:Uncharacterized protein n=1 Tax=Salix dunnii TaxID=1413687 RepID=A0A835KGI7_9ROSI|nr:hypothetical protein SADUNF_Sadunf03G0065300 [Salix dunnii]
MLSREACKYVFCVLVGLSCVFFLIFATYENAKHGPQTVRLSIHLSSLTFKELNLGTSGKLDTVWNTSFSVFAMNPMPGASFSPTRGSFAFVEYRGVGISCGELVEDGEELPMGVGNVSTLQFKSKPCDFPNQIDDELGAELRSDLDRKEVRLGLNFKIRSGFKNKEWSWVSVLVISFCDNLLVQFDSAQRQWLFMGNGSTACIVQTPLVIQ